MPLPRRIHKAAEDSLREFVLFEIPLRMPLHSQDKMIVGGGLYRFDDTVIGACHNLQPVSRLIDGLVMAGVYPPPKLTRWKCFPIPQFVTAVAHELADRCRNTCQQPRRGID